MAGKGEVLVFKLLLVLINLGIIALAAIEYQIAKKRGLSLYTKLQAKISFQLGVVHLIIGLTLMAYLYDLIKVSPQNKLFVLPDNLFWQVAFFFVIDFFAYWNHRLLHYFPLFWADHAVHHSCTEYNFLTHFQQGWTGFVSSTLLFSFILNFVGNTAQVSFAYFIASVFSLTLTHTQLIGRLGVLELILVTPSHHRMHHAIERETHDGNYGLIFIIWDKLFGTYKDEGEKQATQFGLKNTPKLTEPIWSHAFFSWKEYIQSHRLRR